MIYYIFLLTHRYIKAAQLNNCTAFIIQQFYFKPNDCLTDAIYALASCIASSKSILHIEPQPFYQPILE